MAKRQRSRHERNAPAPREKLDDAGMRRIANNCMGYWTVCTAASCRRKRGCTGDAIACFERFWPLTPERLKIRFRATITALSKGVTSAEELDRIVDAEVARAAEQIAYVDAVQAREHEARVEMEAQQTARVRVL